MKRPTPKPYQLEAIRLMNAMDGRVLLADEPGLGKTLEFLWWLKQRPEIKRTLVVCPASVKFVWEHEATRNAGIRNVVLESRTPPRQGMLVPPPLLIINFEILHNWLPWLMRWKPQCVFVDECQNIANTTTLRYKAAKTICSRARYVSGGSGTPIMNRPAEFWPMLNLIRPDHWKNFWSFARRYCNPKRTRWRWVFNGATNLGHLNRSLNKHVMIRRLKSDVLKELPEKIVEVAPVPIIRPHEYAQAKHNFHRWLAKNKPGTKHKKGSEHLVQLGYLIRLAAKLKYPSVVDWIDRFLQETDEKLIVFGEHHQMVKGLHRRYPNSILIYGGTPTKDRKQAVQTFQHDPKCRLAIGTRAMSAGLTLTAARTVLFTELYWRPADHLQASDRPHRIGQKKRVWVHYLVAHGTIEEMMCRLIQTKQENIRQCLDGRGGGESLSVFDELLRILAKEKS